MQKRIRSFDAVASRDATVLILGSMPGERSLAAAEYYAHPRNAFWKIMQEVAGVDATASYQQRLRSLRARGIALWDVLHSCHRKGSLDAAIKHGSVKINNFNALFRKCPRIRVVLFNGEASERYYKRYVLSEIEHGKIKHVRMPSTSPAHAAVPLQQKVKVWRRGIAQQAAARGRQEMTDFQSAAVAEVFARYPHRIKRRLLAVREMIFEVAMQTPGVGKLQETLKWGEPAYLTAESGSGSIIRIDRKKGAEGQYAVYFHCQTTLVDTFRTLFPDSFVFEGNRAIVLHEAQAIPKKELGRCIQMALTYHQRKSTPVGRNMTRRSTRARSKRAPGQRRY